MSNTNATAASIGYFNHNPYPIQFSLEGSPKLVNSGDPIVDASNLLVPPGVPALDKAVDDQLLSLISATNPKFKDWNATATKYTKKPLPAGPDGHPVGGHKNVKANPSP